MSIEVFGSTNNHTASALEISKMKPRLLLLITMGMGMLMCALGGSRVVCYVGVASKSGTIGLVTLRVATAAHANCINRLSLLAAAGPFYCGLAAWLISFFVLVCSIFSPAKVTGRQDAFNLFMMEWAASLLKVGRSCPDNTTSKRGCGIENSPSLNRALSKAGNQQAQ